VALSECTLCSGSPKYSKVIYSLLAGEQSMNENPVIKIITFQFWETVWGTLRALMQFKGGVMNIENQVNRVLISVK
jgi:hypothetical protein